MKQLFCVFLVSFSAFFSTASFAEEKALVRPYDDESFFSTPNLINDAGFIVTYVYLATSSGLPIISALWAGIVGGGVAEYYYCESNDLKCRNLVSIIVD